MSKEISDGMQMGGVLFVYVVPGRQRSELKHPGIGSVSIFEGLGDRGFWRSGFEAELRFVRGVGFVFGVRICLQYLDNDVAYVSHKGALVVVPVVEPESHVDSISAIEFNASISSSVGTSVS